VQMSAVLHWALSFSLFPLPHLRPSAPSELVSGLQHCLFRLGFELAFSGASLALARQELACLERETSGQFGAPIASQKASRSELASEKRALRNGR